MRKKFFFVGLACILFASFPSSGHRQLYAAMPLGGPMQGKQSKAEKQREKDKVKAVRLQCAIISKFFDTGAGGYEVLKAARNFDEGDNRWVAYDSALIFPGTSKCVVYSSRVTGGDSRISCIAPVPGEVASDDEALKKWNRAFIESIKPCIPKSWAERDDGDEHPDGYFSMAAGSRGPRLEVQVLRGQGAEKELHLDFYSK
jgi:hypothetical protein